MGVNIHINLQLTVTPKNVKPLSGDTKSHSKFQPNTICNFGAISAQRSDDSAAAAVANTDDGDGRKSHPYMSPSYNGDTKAVFFTIRL